MMNIQFFGSDCHQKVTGSYVVVIDLGGVESHARSMLLMSWIGRLLVDFDQPVGNLGTLDANEKGKAFYPFGKQNMKIGNMIGLLIAIYNIEDRSNPGLTGVVIVRTTEVGENYKKLCTCNGTTIWKATNSDFITSKV